MIVALNVPCFLTGMEKQNDREIRVLTNKWALTFDILKGKVRINKSILFYVKNTAEGRDIFSGHSH